MDWLKLKALSATSLHWWLRSRYIQLLKNSGVEVSSDFLLLCLWLIETSVSKVLLYNCKCKINFWIAFEVHLRLKPLLNTVRLHTIWIIKWVSEDEGNGFLNPGFNATVHLRKEQRTFWQVLMPHLKFSWWKANIWMHTSSSSAEISITVPTCAKIIYCM